MSLSILHIVNDFTGTAVHKNLIASLDSEMVSQKIYTPVRDSSLINKNRIELKIADSEIIYSHVLNLYTRLFFTSKISKVLRDIEQKIDVQKIDLIHAHTWYSDGAVAYELCKRYGKPYIVAVRNTDLNIFFRYFVHLREYGKKILQNADRIIFLSPVYLSRLTHQAYFTKAFKNLSEKCIIIPNGIDSFWIKNVKRRRMEVNSPLQLLYIGNFNSGKNVLGLLEAVNHLNNEGQKCHLHLVGGGGSKERQVVKYVDGSDRFSYHGIIRDQKALEKLFSMVDIFTMPSHHETFGLVYIEALSQGIPIIYTTNEGIDGLYPDRIGEGVDSKILNSICRGIQAIRDNYKDYDFIPENIVANHNWPHIAKKYLSLYQDVISKIK